MSKIVPMHETEHYAVISAKHITQLPISGADPVKRLLSLWTGFYEDLLAAGYRPIHRFHRPQAVLCEKFNEVRQIQANIGHLKSAIQSLGESHAALEQSVAKKRATKKRATKTAA